LYTVVGEHISQKDPAVGVYVLSLLRGADIVRQFTTGSPAVAGAAAYLLEKDSDPVELADSWLDPNPDPSLLGVVSLDRAVSGSGSLGDNLVVQAETLQGHLAAQSS
jgi:hypothetical protein